MPLNWSHSGKTSSFHCHWITDASSKEVGVSALNSNIFGVPSLANIKSKRPYRLNSSASQEARIRSPISFRNIQRTLHKFRVILNNELGSLTIQVVRLIGRFLQTSCFFSRKMIICFLAPIITMKIKPQRFYFLTVIQTWRNWYSFSYPLPVNYEHRMNGVFSQKHFRSILILQTILTPHSLLKEHPLSFR